MNARKSWKWTRAAVGLLAMAALLIGCDKKETHSEHDGHDHAKTNSPAHDDHKGHNHGPGGTATPSGK